jgi:hypothetical protein
MEQPQELAIRITVGHCLGGAGNDVKAGAILHAPRDLPIAEALRKVNIRYAEIVELEQKPGTDPGTPSVIPGPEKVVNGDPVIETRDPEVEAVPSAGPTIGELRRGRPRAGGRKTE